MYKLYNGIYFHYQPGQITMDEQKKEMKKRCENGKTRGDGHVP